MLENIFILITITYIISLTIGFIIEKYLRMPWIFSALFFGIAISAFGDFSQTIRSEAIQMLATLGMLLILFLIGFNMNIIEIKKLKKQVIASTLLIIIFEGIMGSLLFYFGFPSLVNHSFLIAFITALSFATVGEAILMPILREFKIINTTFGQLILGIATVDDIIELITIIGIGAILSSKHFITEMQALPSPFIGISALCALIIISFILIRLKEKINAKLNQTFKNNDPMRYLIIITIFFIFISIGGVQEGLAPVAAILSGIVSKQLFPKNMVKNYSKIIDFIGYLFLGPIFFLSIGAEVNISSILVAPLLIVFIGISAVGAKLLASLLVFRKLLGKKLSLLMGLGLSIRFSTSLVLQYLLFKNGLISLTLYSSLIGTAVLITPIIIYLYSFSLSHTRLT